MHENYDSMYRSKATKWFVPLNTQDLLNRAKQN